MFVNFPRRAGDRIEMQVAAAVHETVQAAVHETVQAAQNGRTGLSDACPLLKGRLNGL